MANDMMNTLKSMLGDNAEEKIQGVLQSLSDNTEYNGEGNTTSDFNTNDYIMQIKNIVSQIEHSHDSRSNLLLSLKPYMRAERKKSIDSAVKLLNLTRIAGIFK